MKKTIYKFATVLVVISMFSGVFSVGKSYAYFSDTATISGNTFTAGTLSFSLNPDSDFTPLPLGKGEATSTSVTLINDGSLGFQYTSSTTITGGDSDLCNYLTLQASLNGVSVYDGSLSGFLTAAQNYADPSAWNFVVSLPSGATDGLQDKTCNFKFTFNGWQEGLPSTQGFSDTEQISGSITSGHWSAPINSSVVLNEILPNPEGDDNQHGLQGEWVELYNNGNTSVDLAGWMIKDLAGNTKTISSANTMNGRTMIGPKGSYLEWVVVFMNDAVLDNGGDTVYLKDQADNTIDQYAYGNSGNDDDSDSNSTGGGSNSNPSGSETAGNEGKSYARIPDGVGAWVDPVPTPGWTNDFSEILNVTFGTTTEKIISLATTTESIATSTDSTVSTTESVVDDSSATSTATTTPETIPDVSTSTEPAIIPSEPEGPVISEPEPVVVPELVIEPDSTSSPQATPVVESPALAEPTI